METFLQTLANRTVSPFTDKIPITNLKGDLITVDPLFAAQIGRALERLARFFGAKDNKRPLNSLILGPPGSGKSFIAKQLGSSVNALLLEFNLSQYERPSDIHGIFEEIGNFQTKLKDQNIVALLDEFDVRVQGISALQHLIGPIYDGRDRRGNDLRNTAFVFSGSYLKERALLDRLMANSSGFDLIRLLYDAFMMTNDADARSAVLELLSASTQYKQVRELQTPDRNVLDYLRSLEKVTDFISRLNGFIIEVPNIESPLEITTKRYILENREKNKDPIVPIGDYWDHLIPLVKAIEQNGKRFSVTYHDPYVPILEYKNMILRERLSRIGFLLRDRAGKTSQIHIDRSALCFLAVVPLVHGMRSLETLISTVRVDKQEAALHLDPELCRMHIREFEHYESPGKVWSMVREANRKTFETNPSLETRKLTLVVK